MELTTAEKFARNFYIEKETFRKETFSKDCETFVSQKIKELNLNKEQLDILEETISQLLTDVFYTILLGLDGSASIGCDQEAYKIYDEEGNLVSDCGELEAEAYAYFYEDKMNSENDD